MGKVHMKKQIGLLLLALTAMTPLQAFAQEASELAGVRKDISAIGEEVCGKFSSDGQTISAEAKAGITVSLNQIFKKILDGKVESSVSGKIERFSNVLQKDLPQHNKNILQCKMFVFEEALKFVRGERERIDKVKADKEKAAVENANVSKAEAAGATRSPIPTGSCANSVYVYREKNSLISFTSQEIWRCEESWKRRVATNKTGLTPSEAMIVDGNRGRISVYGETTNLLWGASAKNLLSVKIKNTGPVTVRIDSIEFLREAGVPVGVPPELIKLPFVIFPAQEVRVPAVDIEALSRIVNGGEGMSADRYDVLAESDTHCEMPLGIAGCSVKSHGFALAVKYTDIFNDRYTLNKLEYLVTSYFNKSVNGDVITLPSE